jgi:hypothetical protein
MLLTTGCRSAPGAAIVSPAGRPAGSKAGPFRAVRHTCCVRAPQHVTSTSPAQRLACGLQLYQPAAADSGPPGRSKRTSSGIRKKESTGLSAIGRDRPQTPGTHITTRKVTESPAPAGFFLVGRARLHRADGSGQKAAQVGFPCAVIRFRCWIVGYCLELRCARPIINCVFCPCEQGTKHSASKPKVTAWEA